MLISHEIIFRVDNRVLTHIIVHIFDFLLPNTLSWFYKNIGILSFPTVLQKQSTVDSSRADGEMKEADSSY